MPESYPAATIIFAEISAILLAIFVFLTVRYMRNYRDLMQALTRLAQKFRVKRDDRLTMLKNFLQTTCNYPETTAEEVASELLTKEKLFYSTILEIYRNRDNKALKNLDETTEQMIGAYRNLLAVTMESVTRDVQQDVDARTRDMAATIEQLTQKNITMAEEINKLQKEMNVTLAEYASAFARDQAAKNAASTAIRDETADNTEPMETTNEHATDSSPDDDTSPDAPDDQLQPETDSQHIDENPDLSDAISAMDVNPGDGGNADNNIQFPEQGGDEEFAADPDDNTDMPDTPVTETKDTDPGVPSLDDIAIELETLAEQRDDEDNVGGNNAA